jgi:hypothetical protein
VRAAILANEPSCFIVSIVCLPLSVTDTVGLPRCHTRSQPLHTRLPTLSWQHEGVNPDPFEIETVEQLIEMTTKKKRKRPSVKQAETSETKPPEKKVLTAEEHTARRQAALLRHLGLRPPLAVKDRPTSPILSLGRTTKAPPKVVA